MEKEQSFIRFVRSCFVLKRKTLKNNLKSIENIDVHMQNAGLAGNIRGEQMKLEDFIRLFETING